MPIGVKLECGRNYLRELKWANKKEKKKEKEIMASEVELESQLLRSSLAKHDHVK